MNVYFLVEGRRTEKKVYPAWLGHLVPELRRVAAFDEVYQNSYFIFSAEGYPSILTHHLPNAVRDVNNMGMYDYLILCLDADEYQRPQREREVIDAVRDQGLTLNRAQLKVVVQFRCIETWFLGNRRVVSRNPQSGRLLEYLRFFDIRTRDPEAMDLHPDFLLHAPFHAAYLREVLRERGLVYTKSNPGHVCDRAYLEELIRRLSDHPGDLCSLRDFVEFCGVLRASVTSQ